MQATDRVLSLSAIHMRANEPKTEGGEGTVNSIAFDLERTPVEYRYETFQLVRRTNTTDRRWQPLNLIGMRSFSSENCSSYAILSHVLFVALSIKCKTNSEHMSTHDQRTWRRTSIINHEQSTRCAIINNFRKLIVVAVVAAFFFAGAILLSLPLLCSFAAFISLNFVKIFLLFRSFWHLFYSVVCEMRNFCVVGTQNECTTVYWTIGGGSVYGAMHWKYRHFHCFK